MVFYSSGLFDASENDYIFDDYIGVLVYVYAICCENMLLDGPSQSAQKQAGHRKAAWRYIYWDTLGTLYL